ncbi:MAG TPA: hypothetical protein PKH79_05120 [Prolixibacteraceae bacterium]|nr:hypothetical protein [Prolixibacteraceae bacterium]HPS13854.1 hypothetical protein [Prolixibacteraceae bacterium]
MKIDRDNYEICFIDYLDGNLSLDEVDALLDFLNENPELKEELKGLEQIRIEETNEATPDFYHLRKEDLDLPEIFEETCIRAIEEDITEKERLQFTEYLKENEEGQKIFELFHATISEPDPFIVYDHKEKLKKKERAIVLKYWYAIAAVIVLGLFFLLPRDKNTVVPQEIQIAQTNENKTSVPMKIEKEPEVKAVVPEVKKAGSKLNTVTKKAEATPEIERIAEVIEPMKPLDTEITIDRVITENFDLAQISPVKISSEKDYSKYLTIQQFIAKKMKESEKKGVVERFALNTLKKITGDKFTYQTNDVGKVKMIEFNSQLFAFSIPVNEEN